MTDTMTTGRTSRRLPWPWLIGVLLVLVLIGWRVVSGIEDAHQLAQISADQSVPVVSAVSPVPSPSSQEVALPGTVRGVAETAIYARTSGYLKRWLVDIGAHVKAGQLLAEIDAPDVDAQLRQVNADLETAKANSSLADITADRWRALLKTDSVSRQEADEKFGDATAKRTMVAAARANLARLQELAGFERVVAPFDGIITQRNVDNGALITAGAGNSVELFHLSDPRLLRIDVEVPEPDAASINRGEDVEIMFPEHPGKAYHAKVARTAEGLQSTSRSLPVELELDNSNGELMPGGYALAHFKVDGGGQSLRVPASALIMDKDGLRVAVLVDGNKASFRKVLPGRDFGLSLEILSGLGPNDRVIANPPDALVEGEQVRLAPPPAPADAPKS